MTNAAEFVNKRFPGAGAEAIKCDVSKEGDVKVMVGKAVEKWGRLDVMVCSGFTQPSLER